MEVKIIFVRKKVFFEKPVVNSKIKAHKFAEHLYITLQAKKALLAIPLSSKVTFTWR